MIELSPEQIAAAAAAEITARGAEGPPQRAVIDSREAGPGDLFVALRGENVDGGEFAADALASGAWGVIAEPQTAAALGGGWVFSTAEPLQALGGVATAWRRRLGSTVIGVTGSVGKTSVKDIAAALLPGRVHASPQNFNTEIGLPLAVLGAEPGTDVLVLEMAMRGAGQIAELAAIAEPDVAVITNVGPVHVELLGSVEAIAAVKAEILAGLGSAGTAVAPADAGALEPHLGGLERLLRFGEGGQVQALERTATGASIEALIDTPAGRQGFAFPFTEDYNLTNALAAIAAGVAIGAPLEEMAAAAPRIGFSRLRGEQIDLGGGILLVNDCYNANPVSMRAALDHLGSLPAQGRRIAVLGVMAELGPEAEAYHRGIGAHARTAGIETLIGVGAEARAYDPDELVADPSEAAELLDSQLGPDDRVLIKGSRSAGLEAVAEELQRLRGKP